MEPKKRFDGYRSFSDLVPGEDFVEFDLAPQIGRVEPTLVALDAEGEARADRLLRDTICVSLQEHGGVAPLDWDDNDAYIR
jgi:membrane dipeptidase